ncbi:hypothetical protein CHS0354_036645 [Potamilus streckersoni]|uniref:Sulfatase N-terminal domain-containing protein n=1 Tax=Potamilus streckersoni TaxID=2493646 RepID=A0AAE0W1G8_9BIVA|nr:hypothetical protein CHS0354_036645 [Potamilus streckersoni]
MRREMFLPTLLVTAVLLSLSSARPPHIVLIVADDLGWNDVGWHNPQMYTPNLDKLARNGVILNSSYVQPICTPTRNCLMTGFYPYHTGLQHFVILDDTPGYIPTNFTTLPEKLKQLGYSTHMVGKWHLGYCNWKYTPTYRGFDSFMGYYNGREDYYTHEEGTGYDFRLNKDVHYLPQADYSAHTFARRAIDIIISVDPQKESLFLYLPFQSVHEPLQVPEKYEKIYSNIQNKERRIYCGMVSALDEAVGNITNVLRERGFMDNLLLVFTSDNGGNFQYGANNLPLRGNKNTLWEGGTKGAAFVYSETLLKKKNYENTEMMHAVDLFPTLLHVAGGSPDPGIDGMDMWPTISENKASPRTEFIYNIDDIDKNAAIRVGDYKLIEGIPGQNNGWYPLPTREVHFQEEDSVGRLNVDIQYQLFDIKHDPTEHFDISEKYPDVLEKLKQRLAEYKKSLVPAFSPPPDPKANPKYYNGTWSPGWC